MACNVRGVPHTGEHVRHARVRTGGPRATSAHDVRAVQLSRRVYGAAIPGVVRDTGGPTTRLASLYVAVQDAVSRLHG